MNDGIREHTYELTSGEALQGLFLTTRGPWDWNPYSEQPPLADVVRMAELIAAHEDFPHVSRYAVPCAHCFEPVEPAELQDYHVRLCDDCFDRYAPVGGKWAPYVLWRLPRTCREAK